jgi:glucuronosyltransferase
MKLYVVYMYVLFIAISKLHEISAARILALVWQRTESHFPMFETLLKALASRGHEVLVVSHFPQKTPVKNYKDVSVDGSSRSLRNNLTSGLLDPEIYVPQRLINDCVEACEDVLRNHNTTILLKSEDKFDLIITEFLVSDCFLGFVHKFKAPYVALIASVPYPWSNDRTANPDNPAYIPNYFSQYTDRMSFWERLRNTVQTEIIKWVYYSYSEKPTHRIASKYFCDDLPPLSDIARNVSVVLVNSHFSINQPRPTVPAVVEVGGLHIQSPKKLPQVRILDVVSKSPSMYNQTRLTELHPLPIVVFETSET